MKTKLHKRVLSALLAAIMLISYLPLVEFVHAGASGFYIAQEGEPVSSISFYRNEKPAVTAEGMGDSADYQWQIKMPYEDTWVDLYGHDSKTLTLSFAMLRNIVNESNITYVRCSVKSDDGTEYTDAVQIYSNEEYAPIEPSDEYTIPTMPLSEAQAGLFDDAAAESTEETTEPTEETTEPTEETTEPTEETTEPTEETTEPTEETTEPTEETTEPTEETTEPAEVTTEPTEETTEPTEGTTAPTEETTAPTEKTTVPTEETTVPTEETTGSTEETENPAADISDLFDIGDQPRIVYNNGMRSNASALPEESTETRIFTITVNYLYDANNAVWPSYSAKIEEGKPFNQSITLRAFPGYGPVLKNTIEGVALSADLSTLDFTISELKGDLEVNVYYEKVPVVYRARYFIQNMANDLYTEYGSVEAFEGYAGEEPDEDDIFKEIPGFTSLFHQPDTIAADGSTVFECYYDRNYYLINFDNNGGYGAEPVYARYETPFHVATPSKTGYVFDGWDLVSIKDELGKMVLTDTNGNTHGLSFGEKCDVITAIGVLDASAARPVHVLGNYTYKARWATTNTAKYTVVYWLQSAAAGEEGIYRLLHSQVISGVESGSPISAADHSDLSQAGLPADLSGCHYVYNSEKTLAEESVRSDLNDDGEVIVSGDDSTVLNVYFTRKVYKLQFYFAKSVTDNGSTKYFIAGGTTEPFATETSSALKDKLENVTHWGQIQALPKPTRIYDEDDVKELVYGTETSNTTYYYLEFEAKYGEDIRDKWPVDLFDAATLQTEGDFGSNAYFSAWTVEGGTLYDDKNSNKTIKGTYLKLDDQLLMKDASKDKDTMYFLAFWENGYDLSGNGWNKPHKFTYKIYLEKIGNEPDGTEFKTYNGKDYYCSQQFVVYDNSNVAEQTATAVEGYTYTDRQQVSSTVRETVNGTVLYDYEIHFYYDRTAYQLSYYNRNATMTLDDGAAYLEVDYYTPLVNTTDTNYFFVPPYPQGVEENVYEFQGWYTSAGFYADSVVNTRVWDENGQFDTTNTSLARDQNGNPVMPANNLTLYAKWTPVTHDVVLYYDYKEMTQLNPETNAAYEPYAKRENIAHGEYITQTVQVPSHKTDPVSYSFIGWFYMQEGEKVAFDPNAMTIEQDLNLFAEWRTKITTDYTIRYVYKDDQGNERVLAEDTTGYLFVGTTKTFKAKSVTQLDNLTAEEKNQLWLPTVSSHSILMDADAKNNVYTFYYVILEKAPYTVRYLESSTGKVLHSEAYYPDNTNAVVTETFLPISITSGSSTTYYLPDAFRKQLILSAENSQNVITFYYSKVEALSSPWIITHYTQDENGQYTYEYKVETGYAEVGTEISASPLTGIQGYEHNASHADQVLKGTVTENGLELKLFYDRAKRGYKVQYIDNSTKNPLKDEVSYTGKYFDTVVTETAPDIVGYALVGDKQKSLTISLDENRNVITFYYEPKPITINYVAKCIPEITVEFGSVTQNIEIANGLSHIAGTAPIKVRDFYFDGWYTDEACTTKVPDDWITDPTMNYLIPAITEKNLQEDVYEYTYYALFRPVEEVLTIEKTGAAGSDSTLYSVTGTNVLGDTINLTVSIQGSGSVTIKGVYCGSYAVTELTNWSWTYEAQSSTVQSKTVTDADNDMENTVSFANTSKTVYWLHGEAGKEKQG